MPCPHCSHRQWLRFEQLRWDKGQPETAAYICESCDTAIAEHHKTWMLEHGEWRAMITDGAGKTAGYRVGSVPQGGLLLVGAADVQKDRIETSVWAFDRITVEISAERDGLSSWQPQVRVMDRAGYGLRWGQYWGGV